ncbi:permease [Virgibacillus dakarensis]|nr:permease [Virgibacillus dakarensis]
MKMLSKNHLLIDITGLFIFCLVISITTFGESIKWMVNLPESVYQMNMLFLSILIEALPFVLIGVLIAGIIQVFVTDEHIRRWIPKNRFMAVTMSCVVGACFPACECGIVPIVRRLVAKGVPIYAGIGFLLTGPLINPIVIISTYMAFGNDVEIALLRMIIGFLIAMIIAIIVSLLVKGDQLKISARSVQRDGSSSGIWNKIGHMFMHSIDEFFDIGKYLFIGAALAAFVQTYISSADLVSMGNSVASSTAIMMGLAYILSLCSEADAFIGASFGNLFPVTSILGFLIFGPMVDLKNTFMMLSVFKTKFVMVFVFLVAVIVFITLMIFHQFYLGVIV